MRKVLYIFGILTDADVESLVRMGFPRRLRDGEVVIEESKLAKSLVLLLEGEFQVTRKGMGQIARLGVGEIVGEMSLVDPALPSATITARGPCLALFVDKAILLKKLESDVAFACRFYWALSVFLADRLRATMKAPSIGEHSVDDEAAVLEDELDVGILDAISSAGERFQRMLKTVSGQAA